MNTIKKTIFFKIISIIIIVAFLNLDIAWAYPELAADSTTLSGQSIYQPVMMTHEAVKYQGTIFGEKKLLTSVFAAGECLLSSESSDGKQVPLEYFEHVMRNEVPAGFLEGIALEHVVPIDRLRQENPELLKEALLALGLEGLDADEHVVIIPFTDSKGKKHLIQIALKSEVSPEQLAGYELDPIIDKYLIKILPIDYSGQKEAEAESQISEEKEDLGGGIGGPVAGPGEGAGRPIEIEPEIKKDTGPKDKGSDGNILIPSMLTLASVPIIAAIGVLNLNAMLGVMAGGLFTLLVYIHKPSRKLIPIVMMVPLLLTACEGAFDDLLGGKDKSDDVEITLKEGAGEDTSAGIALDFSPVQTDWLSNPDASPQHPDITIQIVGEGRNFILKTLDPFQGNSVKWYEIDLGTGKIAVITPQGPREGTKYRPGQEGYNEVKQEVIDILSRALNWDLDAATKNIIWRYYDFLVNTGSVETEWLRSPNPTPQHLGMTVQLIGEGNKLTLNTIDHTQDNAPKTYYIDLGTGKITVCVRVSEENGIKYRPGQEGYIEVKQEVIDILTRASGWDIGDAARRLVMKYLNILTATSGNILIPSMLTLASVPIIAAIGVLNLNAMLAVIAGGLFALLVYIHKPSIILLHSTKTADFDPAKVVQLGGGFPFVAEAQKQSVEESRKQIRETAAAREIIEKNVNKGIWDFYDPPFPPRALQISNPSLLFRVTKTITLIWWYVFVPLVMVSSLMLTACEGAFDDLLGGKDKSDDVEVTAKESTDEDASSGIALGFSPVETDWLRSPNATPQDLSFSVKIIGEGNNLTLQTLDHTQGNHPFVKAYDVDLATGSIRVYVTPSDPQGIKYRPGQEGYDEVKQQVIDFLATALTWDLDAQTKEVIWRYYNYLTSVIETDWLSNPNATPQNSDISINFKVEGNQLTLTKSEDTHSVTRFEMDLKTGKIEIHAPGLPGDMTISRPGQEGYAEIKQQMIDILAKALGWNLDSATEKVIKHYHDLLAGSSNLHSSSGIKRTLSVIASSILFIFALLTTACEKSDSGAGHWTQTYEDGIPELYKVKSADLSGSGHVVVQVVPGADVEIQVGIKSGDKSIYSEVLKPDASGVIVFTPSTDGLAEPAQFTNLSKVTGIVVKVWKGSPSDITSFYAVENAEVSYFKVPKGISWDQLAVMAATGTGLLGMAQQAKGKKGEPTGKGPRDIMDVTEGELLDLIQNPLNRKHVERLLVNFTILWRAGRKPSKETLYYEGVAKRLLIAQAVDGSYGTQAMLDKPQEFPLRVLEENGITVDVDSDIGLLIYNDVFRKKDLTLQKIESSGLSEDQQDSLKMMYVHFCIADSIDMGSDYLKKVEVREAKGEKLRSFEKPLDAYNFQRNDFKDKWAVDVGEKYLTRDTKDILDRTGEVLGQEADDNDPAVKLMEIAKSNWRPTNLFSAEEQAGPVAMTGATGFIGSNPTELLTNVAVKQEGKDPKPLFELVESSLNSKRAKLEEVGNEIMNYLIDNDEGTLQMDVSNVNRTKSTAEMKKRLEEILDELKDFQRLTDEDESLTKVPGNILANAVYVRANLGQLEGDSIIATIITLARKAQRENQKLIIGIETDWIPGLGRGNLQQNAINPLLKMIESLDEEFKKIGLDNVILVPAKGGVLAEGILKEADTNSTNLTNVVVLASKDTINSDKFAPLRTVGNQKGAFLAGVDVSELVTFYKANGEAVDKQLFIKIMQMLSITLELASGKDAPSLPIIVNYDKTNRMVIFFPKAEPKDYNDLQKEYKMAIMSLIAA